MALRVADDVVLHEEAGEAFLLHVGSGRYYGLNRSGLIVWNALAHGHDPIDAVRQEWPDRAVDQLQADAESLIDRLLGVGLLIDDAGPRSG